MQQGQEFFFSSDGEAEASKELLEKKYTDLELPAYHMLDNFDRNHVPPLFFERFMGKGRSFPYFLFKGLEMHYEMSLPEDVDGVKHIKLIGCDLDNLTTLMKNRRHFEFSTCKKKGFQGVRRLARCQGHFMCKNERCTKLLTTGNKNTTTWSFEDGQRLCYACSESAVRSSCGAIILVEMDTFLMSCQVFHMGKHSCKLAPKRQREEIASLIRRNARLTPKHLQKAAVAEAVDCGDIEKVSWFLYPWKSKSIDASLSRQSTKSKSICCGSRSMLHEVEV